MYSVTKKIEFCYGHRLLDYDGVCKHPHGHNAVAEIEVRTDSLDARNMVADFSDIKRLMKGWIDRELDHKMILRHDDPMVAPLQALGEPVSAATDTWGIGLVLYEAATGHRPFGDGGDMWSCRCGEDDCSWSEPRYLQLERRAPKIRARRRLPVEVAAAIDACLDRDPARRPTLDALDDALGGLLP